jgi:hypothetical protein
MRESALVIRDRIGIAYEAVALAIKRLEDCIRAGVPPSDLKWSVGALEDAQSDLRGISDRYDCE